MAKKSKKRLGRLEKDQSGCMWSLINIFDFRNGRASQKLLTDKKRGSKRIVGATYPDIVLESLADTCEISEENNEDKQSETSTNDTSKMSVKALMEEEMVGEDQKKQSTFADEDTKQTATTDGGHGRKDRRWTRSKMSLDLDANGFVTAEGLTAQKRNHRKHKSLSCVDLNVMVEELYSQIHEKDVCNSKHDGENKVQPMQDPSSVEDRLEAATKVLVNHLTHGKSFTSEGRVQHSKELVDALQVLNSNKEEFLKLLQDPNSQLVKHIKSWQEIQVEEGKLKVLTGSSLLEQDPEHKQHSYFWRRFKGLERSQSKRSQTSDDLSTIVVLKPSPRGSKDVEMASTCGSLSDSPLSAGGKGQPERVSSSFSFSEFKRKLKQAMKKDQHGVVDSGMSHQTSDAMPIANRDKKVGVETVGMASPSRDHFFIERIPKLSVGGKSGKLKDGKFHLEIDSSSEQRAANLYVEAKKHLAEIVGNGNADVDTQGRQVSKPLGRILSYSGYSSPTVCSPRPEVGTRLSVDGNVQTGSDQNCQVIQDLNYSLPSHDRQKSESEANIATEDSISAAEVSTSEPFTSNSKSTLDEPTDVDLPTTEDTFDSQQESSRMDIPARPCLLESSIASDQIACPHSEEKQLSTISGQDECDENEPSPSLNASTPSCSLTEKTEDIDAMSDATSRPSPISVLDPVFREDDMSPPGMKSFAATESIQPRHIRFEEDTAVPFHVVYNKFFIEDDKYTVKFVKDVVQMSGLTWDELLRRSLLSEHVIDPALLDEVDFLPDLLCCDFNLLFDLINEVLIEIFLLNFGCMLSCAKPFVQPDSKGKDIFTEVWKGVEWHLKLMGPPRILEHVVANDLARPLRWMDLQFDCEGIGIQLQEAILEELVEDIVVSCAATPEREDPLLPPAEANDSEISVEM